MYTNINNIISLFLVVVVAFMSTLITIHTHNHYTGDFRTGTNMDHLVVEKQNPCHFCCVVFKTLTADTKVQISPSEAMEVNVTPDVMISSKPSFNIHNGRAPPDFG